MLLVKEVLSGVWTPTTMAESTVQGIVVLLVTYIGLWILIKNILILRAGWKPLSFLVAITIIFATYSQAKYGLLTSLMLGGFETPIDSEILNSYYSLYDQVVRLLRYVLYILGVVP